MHIERNKKQKIDQQDKVKFDTGDISFSSLVAILLISYAFNLYVNF